MNGIVGKVGKVKPEATGNLTGTLLSEIVDDAVLSGDVEKMVAGLADPRMRIEIELTARRRR